jgi:hypothetical protein
VSSEVFVQQVRTCRVDEFAAQLLVVNAPDRPTRRVESDPVEFVLEHITLRFRPAGENLFSAPQPIDLVAHRRNIPRPEANGLIPLVLFCDFVGDRAVSGHVGERRAGGHLKPHQPAAPPAQGIEDDKVFAGGLDAVGKLAQTQPHQVVSVLLSAHGATAFHLQLAHHFVVLGLSGSAVGGEGVLGVEQEVSPDLPEGFERKSEPRIEACGEGVE